MTSESRKIDIKSLSQKQLIHWIEHNGEKSFKADQILKWIYQKQTDNFDKMTNLSKNLQQLLDYSFTIKRLQILSTKTSKDGSKKYTIKLKDNNIIQTILLPEQNHSTLCVSSQIGCAQKCTFCMTTKNGFIRNLESEEIIAQVRDIQNLSKNINIQPITNVVFMGMGEPLANYKQVIKTIKILTNNNYGLKFSPKRITISTSGLISKIKKLSQESNVNLAISLNAADNQTRNKLMPINKIYPIETLIKTCQNYHISKKQKIMFEYIMIKEINDRISDAKKLVKLIKKTKAKINLIPFNEHKKCKYKRSSTKNIIKFQKYLIKNNITTTIRLSKGQDISAACGQLNTEME